MIRCPKCGGTAKIKASYPIQNGQVRRLLCTGCGGSIYTTETIQDDGTAFYEAYRIHHSAWLKSRAVKRALRVRGGAKVQ